MPRLLIFDYDGVIADSYSQIYGIYRELAEKYGLDGSEAMFRKLFEGNFYESLKNHGIGIAKMIPEMMDFKKELLKAKGNSPFFPGAKEMLTHLSKHNKVAIITSNFSDFVRDSLRKNGISFITEIMGAEEHQSKVEKIKGMMERYKEHGCYYVGDTVGDIKEGRKAGAKTIAAAWGYHHKELLTRNHPDFIVNSPQELADIFQ